MMENKIEFWWQFDPNLDNWNIVEIWDSGTLINHLNNPDMDESLEEGLYYMKGSGSIMCERVNGEWQNEFTIDNNEWIEKYYEK